MTKEENYTRIVATPHGGGTDLGFERKHLAEIRAIEGRPYDIFQEVKGAPQIDRLAARAKIQFDLIFDLAAMARQKLTHLEVRATHDFAGDIITCNYAYETGDSQQ